MRIFAVADLHLPGGRQKPMDVFGAHWTDHFARISADWTDRVLPEDIVLIPGDISWAMTLSEAKPDIDAIGALPGRKVLLRGNHDYWWNSVSRVRDALPAGMYALQNDAMKIDGCVFCGSRGWLLPCESAKEEDVRLYRRELGRLTMSLDCAARLTANGERIICMTHFPPLTDACRDTEISALLAERRVDTAVYGHLHGESLKGAFRGVYRSVRYEQVSCDGLGFRLKQLE
ncbi:MAG: metallophosphoesterase [Clostridia bacterium]|nr:metallophosphoesterase [Clostridia bacterium]